jgi:hypothetical protein
VCLFEKECNETQLNDVIENNFLETFEENQSINNDYGKE